MDEKVLYSKVKELIVKVFELDPDSISSEKRLNEDLNLDSLDMVDLVIAINDEGICEQIEPVIFKDVCVVGDLVNRLQPFWKD